MKISNATWQQLLNAIASNTYTDTHLDLSSFGLNSKNAIELAKALESNNSIYSLDVHNNKIGDAGFKALIAHDRLSDLDISHNIIGVPDAKGMANNEMLIKAGLEPSYVFSLPGVESLADNHSLTHLNIAHNGLSDKGAQILVDIFAPNHNHTLTHLDISDNGLGGAHEAALAQVLAQDNALINLNIGYNGLHDASVVTLAHSESITDLNLSDSLVEAQGIYALAENTVITSLNLSNIAPVNSYETLDACSALFKNTTLTSLDLHGEQLPYTETYYYLKDYYNVLGAPHYKHCSIDIKEGFLQVLLDTPTVRESFLQNSTLIKFNIQDQVWDPKGETLGAWGKVYDKDFRIQLVENHIADNMAKAHIKTSDVFSDSNELFSVSDSLTVQHHSMPMGESTSTDLYAHTQYKSLDSMGVHVDIGHEHSFG